MIHARLSELHLLDAFAEGLDNSLSANNHIKTSMALLWSVGAESFTREQLLLNPFNLPKIEHVGSLEYWLQAMLGANHKSRRTLAALVLTPGPGVGLGAPRFAEPAIVRFVEENLRAPGWVKTS